MIPDKSNFASAKGAAVWFGWQNPEDPSDVTLYQTQWPTIVGKLQRNAKTLFAHNKILRWGWKADADGNLQCASSDFALDFVEQHAAADLPIDGRWTNDMASLVSWILCMTGDLPSVITLLPRLRENTLPREWVRWVTWLGLFVDMAGVDLTRPMGERVSADERKAGDGIFLPTNMILPTKDADLVVDPRDALWLAISRMGSDIPKPPSMGPGKIPWSDDMTRALVAGAVPLGSRLHAPTDASVPPIAGGTGPVVSPVNPRPAGGGGGGLGSILVALAALWAGSEILGGDR